MKNFWKLLFIDIYPPLELSKVNFISQISIGIEVDSIISLIIYFKEFELILESNFVFPNPN